MRKLLALLLICLCLPLTSFAEDDVFIFLRASGGGTGTVSVSDNFNRADENPLGNGVWTTGTGMSSLQIVSNKVTAVSNTTHSLEYYTGATFASNQYSQATSLNGPSAVFSGLAIRWSGNSGYFVQIDMTSGTNTSYFQRWDSGSQTTVGSFSYAYAQNDVWKLEASGNTITFYVNGVSKGSITDSTYSSGSPGIWFYHNVIYLDDWSGGDL